MKKSNAERCREYRARKKAEREAAKPKRARATGPRTQKAAPSDVAARREAARQRYAAMKETGGAEYRRVLAAAKVRAARWHAKQRAAAKAGSR